MPGVSMNDALEVELARLTVDAQLDQCAHEVAAARAAHATVDQFDDFFVAVLDQKIIVDAFGPELVFDDGERCRGRDTRNRIRLSRVVLPAPEKTGEYGDRHHFANICGVHCLPRNGAVACQHCARYSAGGNAGRYRAKNFNLRLHHSMLLGKLL